MIEWIIRYAPALVALLGAVIAAIGLFWSAYRQVETSRQLQQKTEQIATLNEALNVKSAETLNQLTGERASSTLNPLSGTEGSHCFFAKLGSTLRSMSRCGFTRAATC
jgi:hypothetical protein